MMQIFSQANVFKASENCNASTNDPFNIGGGNAMNCNGRSFTGTPCTCTNSEDNQVDYAKCWFGNASGPSSCPTHIGVPLTTCKFEEVPDESQDRNQICFVTPPNVRVIGACVKGGSEQSEGCIGGTFCYYQSCRTSPDGLQECRDVDTCMEQNTQFCISRPTAGCGISNYNLLIECCPETPPAPPPDIPASNLTPATGQGDPHIETFQGAHYTVANVGTFLAFNFSKKTEFHSARGLQEAPILWQVFARYAGKKFLTHALLLQDRSNHSSRQALELTSDSCKWRQKKSPEHAWQEAKSGSLFVLYDNAFMSGFEITELHKQYGTRPKFGSSVMLKMNTKQGARKVALLSVICRPGRHLDFKMKMFHKSDMDFAGGELGQHISVEGPANHTNHSKVLFLSHSKKRFVQMRTDSEFQTPTGWQDLGGSQNASDYLRSMDQASLLSVPEDHHDHHDCSEEEEQEASKICGKHMAESSEVFADCVFDVCHGGGEEAAEDAAEFIESEGAEY